METGNPLWTGSGQSGVDNMDIRYPVAEPA